MSGFLEYTVALVTIPSISRRGGQDSHPHVYAVWCGAFVYFPASVHLPFLYMILGGCHWGKYGASRHGSGAAEMKILREDKEWRLELGVRFNSNTGSGWFFFFFFLGMGMLFFFSFQGTRTHRVGS